MDWWDLVRTWYALWVSKTLLEHLQSVSAGLVGAGMYAAMAAPQLTLPRYDRQAGTLHLNTLGIVLLSTGTALVVDVAFPVGVLAAVAVPILVPVLNRTAVLRVLDETILPGIARVLLLLLEKKGDKL